MPGRARISFAASAVADLEAIRARYAGQQVPEVGERLLREIVAHVERLADFPESGRVAPEFGLVQLREIIHPPFRIVYRLGEGRVRVVRVWRSERQLELPT
ncbi:MAG: type II toxin-antitoxin system RelE/ParE family toxin [Thermoleophilia bacterium]|nr:type II toxin-antitoxin system RelE/ParE family toxin [Thermoleophilia bacterium]